MSVNQRPQYWQIDKRIPLPLILTVTIQTVGLAVWLGRLNSRVSALEAATAPLLDRAIANSGRLARVDEKLVGVQQQNNDIRDEIRRLALRGSK